MGRVRPKGQAIRPGVANGGYIDCLGSVGVGQRGQGWQWGQRYTDVKLIVVLVAHGWLMIKKNLVGGC